MKATVVVDNISKNNLAGEWGLCIVIAYKDKTILLDTGASGMFLENAQKLGIDIGNIDYAVLSHAHYDHANGMADFFAKNQKAKFYLRDGCGENCYLKKWVFRQYIGLPKHILEQYPERIAYAKGDLTLLPGATLVPHKTEGLAQIGIKNNMYIKSKHGWKPDDFSHEQSLVFETGSGLVIFNSCSHSGVDHIIREVSDTFPGQQIRAYIGGFHSYHQSEAEVRALAGRLKATGVQEIYTGHCTGERQYKILEEELGGTVHQLHSGLVMEFED